MPKPKLFSKKIFYVNSKLWFFLFFIGVFFTLGYSITKKIYISTIFPSIYNQENLNKSALGKNLQVIKKNIKEWNHEKPIQWKNNKSQNQEKNQIYDLDKDNKLPKKTDKLYFGLIF